MAWPVTDFNNVRFNQNGIGYSEVAAIHLAIKERADATMHSLAFGDYANEWTTTPVWLGEPDGVATRTYLKNVLLGFYDDISSLISGDAGIRWTVTPTGGATEWTMASLVADIGMGAFADLLTKPANPQPFIFLHAALDRLLYSYKTCTWAGSQSALSKIGDGILTTLEDAWDTARGDSGTVGGLGFFPIQTSPCVGWYVSNFDNTIGGPPYDVQLMSPTVSNSYTIPDAGTTFTKSAYRVSGDNVANTGITCTFGTASLTINAESSATAQWIHSASADFLPDTTTDIDLEITTVPPNDCPFPDEFQIYTIFNMLAVRGILDLTSILTDQA